MSGFQETPQSADALRRYFEAHESAYQAVTAKSFAACMAEANRAACELRNMQRPDPKVYE